MADFREDLVRRAVLVGGQIVFQRLVMELGAVAGFAGGGGCGVGCCLGACGPWARPVVVCVAVEAGFEQDGLADAAGEDGKEFAQCGAARGGRGGGHVGVGCQHAFRARLKLAQAFALGRFGVVHAESGQAVAPVEAA